MAGVAADIGDTGQSRLTNLSLHKNDFDPVDLWLKTRRQEVDFASQIH
jgi:hypothetical protein